MKRERGGGGEKRGEGDRMDEGKKGGRAEHQSLTTSTNYNIQIRRPLPTVHKHASLVPFTNYNADVDVRRPLPNTWAVVEQLHILISLPSAAASMGPVLPPAPAALMETVVLRAIRCGTLSRGGVVNRTSQPRDSRTLEYKNL